MLSLVTENRLDEWVRGNASEAQGVIVELVARLVAASCPSPKERRFPLGDSIGQHGPDGQMNVVFGFEHFVPEGRSFWEIGTGLRARDKATEDYNSLAAAIPDCVRCESTFVFVTPLSGRREWEHTWKDEGQATWLEERRGRGDWRDVQVIDGTKLTEWIHKFPSVELWLAERTIRLPAEQIETLEQHWNLIKTIGAPPQLTPRVFLTNGSAACAKLNEVFSGTTLQLNLTTHFPDHVVNFVAAYLASLDDEIRSDAASRCLVISGVAAWNAITALRDRHILIADPVLDLSGDTGTTLIQKARRFGHAVIFGGRPGGIPNPSSAPLPAPRIHQLQEALEDAGYSGERARTLAQKSGGNLGSLLRCLVNLSVMPEWAEDSAASELAIAAMLGSWSEGSASDRVIVEAVSGKAYGEWIGTMREIALRPGTPLIQRDGNWKCVARYEVWSALGRRFFDEDLERFRSTVVAVLQERDPQFELPTGQRYASSIYGKDFAHSHLLRSGLAESLALLGSHSMALTSCTRGKAEATATLAVRGILSSADWVRWASLNDQLPLLAEAAPSEFLKSVESALASDPCPFDEVFVQEGDALMGRTYMSGLLWALETLAWDADHLGRVVLCLGELAARDPGGSWGSRPADSLTTILLPWLPQTCARIPSRVSAVAALLSELPDIGWRLVVSLLPQAQSTSHGSRKPTWRETIPDDWPQGAPPREYREQVEQYAEMALTAARNSSERLCALIGVIENLPPVAVEQLLTFLGSHAIQAMPESERLGLWIELADVVARHRKFSDATWAMQREQVDKIAAIADALAPDEPAFRHRRLFSAREFDLYEELGNFEDQRAELENRRRKAVEEVSARGGTQAVIEFALSVNSPWRVGMSCGVIAGEDSDGVVLPGLLEAQQKLLAQFVGGFVWGRFHSRGWQWVDTIDTSQWVPAHVGQFLAFLPFSSETWAHSKRLLGGDESDYWMRASANPHEAETGLAFAIDQLIQHDRPFAAIRCLHAVWHNRGSFDRKLAIRALLAATQSSEDPHSRDTYESIEIIKALQCDASTNYDDLLRVEWAYLPVLDQHRDAAPRLLGQRLANEPLFFCEIIRLAFHSKNSEERPVDDAAGEASKVAGNAYRLLDRWQTPPGCREGGAFHGEFLPVWLNAVRTECMASGHLEIAMVMVGHVLINVPPDPDGMWIHRSAAAVLNAKDAADIRDGFATELLNSRGAHWVDPSGEPEKELASKYREQAEAAEAAGFQRLATTMRQLVASYEREAEAVSSRETADD